MVGCFWFCCELLFGIEMVVWNGVGCIDVVCDEVLEGIGIVDIVRKVVVDFDDCDWYVCYW